jgi:transcriptional regulator with XRE-family HTH domain
MTPARLRECLALLGWDVQQFARRVGYARGTVRQWLDAKARVPWAVQDWLEAAATWHAENPPPPRK